MKKNTDIQWQLAITQALPEIVDQFVGAAVLILLRVKDGKLQVLLTQRSANLRHHANEWSLPGGKLEPNENSLQASLRESNEEIGLLSEQVEILGQLKNFKAKSGQDVAVWVAALCDDTFEAQMNLDEVQQVVWLDLHLLLAEPDRQHRFVRNNQTILIPFYDVLTPSLWGLTAMILQIMVKNLKIQFDDLPVLQTLLSNK